MLIRDDVWLFYCPLMDVAFNPPYNPGFNLVTDSIAQIL